MKKYLDASMGFSECAELIESIQKEFSELISRQVGRKIGSATA